MLAAAVQDTALDAEGKANTGLTQACIVSPWLVVARVAVLGAAVFVTEKVNYNC